jgi:hypothetical protein
MNEKSADATVGLQILLYAAAGSAVRAVRSTEKRHQQVARMCVSLIRCQSRNYLCLIVSKLIIFHSIKTAATAARLSVINRRRGENEKEFEPRAASAKEAVH